MNQPEITPMAANKISQQSPQIPIQTVQTQQTQTGIKFTEEEVKALTTLREKYQKLVTSFGQLYIERIRINDYVTQLNDTESKMQKEYMECQKQEDQLLADLVKVHGEGSLDLSSGIFIPSVKK